MVPPTACGLERQIWTNFIPISQIYKLEPAIWRQESQFREDWRSLYTSYGQYHPHSALLWQPLFCLSNPEVYPCRFFWWLCYCCRHNAAWELLNCSGPSTIWRIGPKCNDGKPGILTKIDWWWLHFKIICLIPKQKKSCVLTKTFGTRLSLVPHFRTCLSASPWKLGKIQWVPPKVAPDSTPLLERCTSRWGECSWHRKGFQPKWNEFNITFHSSIVIPNVYIEKNIYEVAPFQKHISQTYWREIFVANWRAWGSGTGTHIHLWKWWAFQTQMNPKVVHYRPEHG